MKSAFGMAFVSCTLALAAAACSGGGSNRADGAAALGGESGTSEASLRGPHRPPPPEEPPPAPGPFCGGFAGIPCAGSATCVDDLTDDCDPNNGGADCGGVCSCNIRALCVRGSVFDASPEVCACVPPEPVNPCAVVLCQVGSVCEVVGGQGVCTPLENPCNLIDCRSGDVCEVQAGEPVCVPAVNPCAAVLCPVNTTCEVVDGAAVCTDNGASGAFCGGFAGIPCAASSATCVDDPSDDCDPENGGADCGGVCACLIRALCVPGFVFDESPEVCACVPESPELDPCAAVRCAAGTHCEAADDGSAACVADEISACAAVLCLEGTQCVVRRGEPRCVPIAECRGEH